MSKGQIIAVDLIVSLVIFVTAFVIALIAANRVTDQIKMSYEINLLDKKVQRISDVLIRTEGLPSNWNEVPEDEIRSIGLAEYEYILNYSKIDRFRNIDAEKVRKLLGTGEYKFYVSITNITQGNFPEGAITAGNEPSNAEVIVSINRYALINFGERREMGVMSFVLWR
ncbi:MAG: hypothetical protein QMD12_00775 [Candidatus Aenigmarchaeota archaeon]|nr:hypothetical protein [Candidatus Aenigmarchaeota archaeon]